MNVTLILPQYSVSIHDPCFFPLGFAYISATLKQAGHNVKVLNFNLKQYDLEAELAGQGAALFSGFEEFRDFNIITAEWCKEQGIHTAIGGAMATFAPDEMIKYFDAVIMGEGELVIETALHSFGIIQGITPDLDRLPFPDYSGFGIEEYNRLHAQVYMGILTSRGCPYDCRFCAQTCSFQFRDLVSVFEEIDLYMAKYKATHIVFCDNTLNLRKDRFMAICEGMKERGLTWSAAIRVDKFDEEMAIASKESGCTWFVVGVESFIDKKLEAMNKRITSQQITDALDLMHKHKLDYHGNVLLGLPDETYDDIVAELEHMPQEYNVFPVLVQPFIGTEYQTRKITDEESLQLSQAFRDYVETSGMEMYKEAA